MKYHQSKLYSIKGSGLRRGQRGKGAYFFNDAKEMLQKLTLIIAEMEAGNTSIKIKKHGTNYLRCPLTCKSYQQGTIWKIS